MSVAVTDSGLGSSPLTRGKLAVLRALRPGRGDHPRSRGENDLDETETVEVLGSSPLTRGKLTALGHYLDAGGIIPAHAGKTLPDLRFYRADRSDLGKP